MADYEKKAREIVKAYDEDDDAKYPWLIVAIAAALKEAADAETERCAVLAWSIGMDKWNEKMRCIDPRELGSEIAAVIRSKTESGE
jgi:hypothetical protein